MRGQWKGKLVVDVLSSVFQELVHLRTPNDRVLWLVRLLRWLQRPRSKVEKRDRWETVYSSRIKFMLLLLQGRPEWRQPFAEQLVQAVVELARPLSLATVGLPQHPSFLQDLVDRVQYKILPRAPLAHDLQSVVGEVFDDPTESILIDQVDEKLLAEVIAILSASMSEAQSASLKASLRSAERVLSVQLLENAMGLRRLMGEVTIALEALPEYRLDAHFAAASGARNVSGVLLELELADAELSRLESDLEFKGVQVNTVFLIELHRSRLRRLRQILMVQAAIGSQVEISRAVRSLISQMVDDLNSQTSLWAFLRANFALLARRVVHTNSQIGEHYVARTWTDVRAMFRSALGGGALTALTVYVKFLSAQLGVSGFIKGAIDSANYSASFLGIQLMGFTLATKQPSATAPLINRQMQTSIREAGETLLALVRTQLIAVLGNIVAVLPIAWSVAWALGKAGWPLMNAQQAESIIGSTVVYGPTPLFAAWTGVLLFKSSLLGGWFENFCVSTQLPARLANSRRLRQWLGVERAQKIGRMIDEKGDALAGNLSLGLLLGFVPVFMKFFNLPLDVRHVTLATGALASALPYVDWATISMPFFVAAILGLLVIGAINLSVSFLLAFSLASLSSGVDNKKLLKLLKWGLQRILRRPWALFVPERSNREESAV
jgi:site-specific recombinase